VKRGLVLARSENRRDYAAPTPLYRQLIDKLYMYCIGSSSYSKTQSEPAHFSATATDRFPMPAALLPALLFALVTSVTPGPNNTMLLSSGINFGFRRTLPHMLGISCGFTVMMLTIGMGLGQLFERVPALYTAMEVLSVTYLAYLAWKIAASGAPKLKPADHHPLTWLQAALFQWVNPKAWVMALTGATTFHLHEDPRISAVMLAIAFGLVNFPSVSVWAAFGSALRRVLAQPRVLTLFNWSMAALLMASVMPTAIALLRAARSALH